MRKCKLTPKEVAASFGVNFHIFFTVQLSANHVSFLWHDLILLNYQLSTSQCLSLVKAYRFYSFIETTNFSEGLFLVSSDTHICDMRSHFFILSIKMNFIGFIRYRALQSISFKFVTTKSSK